VALSLVHPTLRGQTLYDIYAWDFYVKAPVEKMGAFLIDDIFRGFIQSSYGFDKSGH